MQRAEIHETPGHPIVYAEWMGAPSGKTVLFYGHYDVQPVDPIDLWQSPPFEATVRDGALYARGSADDKGQVFMHFKAIEAYLKTAGSLPVNFKVILEGEEEVGSKNLDEFIASHKDLLAADVVLISDTAMFERGVPSLCYGLRGLLVLPDRPAGLEHRPPQRAVRRRAGEPGDGAGPDADAVEGSQRPDQDSRLLRRRGGR